MKNLILGSVLIFVFLPQISFGATQPTSLTLTAFNDQQNSEAAAFFGQQAADRAAFIKTNAAIVAKQELRFKRLKELRDAQRTGASTATIKAPPDEDAIFAAFVAKQQAEKLAFLSKLAQEKQNFLSSQ